MADLLKDFDFACDPLNVLLVVNFLFFEHFHCNLGKRLGDKVITFSPVRMCVPYLTWPNVPLPSALP